MRQVAVAINTTGPAPMHGARIDELAMVEVIDGMFGKTTHFRIALDGNALPAEGRVPFSEAYATLLALLGRSTLIAHDVYDLNRYLRAECKRAGIAHSIKRDHPAVDTLLLARQRFPRQRHDLDAVAKKFGVEANAGTVGAARSLQLLAGIAVKLEPAQDKTRSEPPAASKVKAPTSEVPVPTVEPVVPSVAQRSFGERLKLCWQVLVGQA